MSTCGQSLQGHVSGFIALYTCLTLWVLRAAGSGARVEGGEVRRG